MANILVVEAKEKTRQELYLLLKAAGHTVTTAEDGQQGLSLARQLRPDLLLAGIVLPGLNGFELCTELKGHTDTVRILIVLLCPADDRETRLHSLNVGADATLQRPIDKQELQSVTARLLRLSEYAATHENREAVTGALVQALELLTGRELDAGAVSRERNYRNKLLELLAWDRERQVRVNAALALRMRLYQDGQPLLPDSQLQRLLNGLKMSRWLLPLLLYKARPHAAAAEFEAEYLQELDEQPVGELVALLQRFLELLTATGDKQQAITALAAEAEDWHHNAEYLALLSQIVADEVFLESLA